MGDESPPYFLQDLFDVLVVHLVVVAVVAFYTKNMLHHRHSQRLPHLLLLHLP
jgi:hypothetical protein